MSERKIDEIENSPNNKSSIWYLFITQSGDPIVILDENGKVYDANQRFADMLGYSLEEVFDLYVWDWDYRFTKEEILEMIKHIDYSADYFETQHRRKDGSIIDVELSNSVSFYNNQKLIFCICRDITERKKYEKEREKLIKELKEALAEIKTLRGIIPICVNCKKIRDDKGYWEKVESYISKHTLAEFSHSLCPDCAKKLYPDLFKDTENKTD